MWVGPHLPLLEEPHGKHEKRGRQPPGAERGPWLTACKKGRPLPSIGKELNLAFQLNATAANASPEPPERTQVSQCHNFDLVKF